MGLIGAQLGAQSGPHVVVIGGGGTGAAVCHDLCLRGFRVSLFERGELTSGSTGRHHGLLHSGARYALDDREVAHECITESRILQRITSGVIERNFGLFVALKEEEFALVERFRSACADADIETRLLKPQEALAMVPRLNPHLRAAVLTPDATLDAFRLPLQFFATARHNGAKIYPFTPVRAIEQTNGRVSAVRVYDLAAQAERLVACDMIVNAGGAWAGQIGTLADREIPLTPGPGIMVAVQGRLTDMVINRLAPPSDGDILVPQRTLTIAGTTNSHTTDPDRLETTEEDTERMIACATEFLPDFRTARVQAVWSAARPLAGTRARNSARTMSRRFVCIDHAKDAKPLEGMVSITGGKATTLRAMAEHTVDLVCAKTGLTRPCSTAEQMLLPHRAYYEQEMRYAG